MQEQFGAFKPLLLSLQESRVSFGHQRRFYTIEEVWLHEPAFMDSHAFLSC